MPTKNRRVATYLPKEIDASFEAFKVARSIEGDSQALITILSEFLGVSQQVAHSSNSAEYATKKELETLSVKVAHLVEQIQDIDGFVERAVKRTVGELPSQLPSELPIKKPEAAPDQLELLEEKDTVHEAVASSKLEIEASSLADGLSARRLEERFNKKGAGRKVIANQKDLPDFAAWSAAQDPEGVAWEYRESKYYPIQDATSSLPSNSLI